MIPDPEAYWLFHEGSTALAQIEANGIRVDAARLDRVIDKIDNQVKDLESQLKSSKEWREWRRMFGDKANLGSRPQLAELVYGPWGHECKTRTPTGRPKADEDALESTGIPFVKTILDVERLKKLRSTHLMGIKRETVNGFLHPFFHLNTVKTYRSSSSDPNWTNIPTRDPILGKMIRSCIIPREGRVLVENDFGALEFRIAACFWKDPKMIEYAKDSNKDIHKDMAAKIFKCNRSQVSKTARYVAKNQFVFPQLYGSWWYKIARFIWTDIGFHNLEVDGVPMKQWLASKGIKEYGNSDPKNRIYPEPGTFEHHIKELEQWFFNYFSVLANAREKWQNDYRKKGYFKTMTGFVESGLYSQNDLLNHPIQGSGFHCLLWTIIKLLKQIKKRKMKSLVVGQIHDCANGDVPVEELQEYLHLVKSIVSKSLPKHWAWIVVPLEIEAEVCPEGGNWFQKEKWIERNGVWGPEKSNV